VTQDSNAVANQALQLIGDNAPSVSGQSPTWDGSTAGIALSKLYVPCVATVARQFGWDQGRFTGALTATGNTPPEPWANEYIYPASAVEIWQILPAAIADPNNPLPVNWNVANNLVSGTQTKVIQCNVANALAVYNNNPAESTWDALFREAVVRLLASELSMALFGRPDSSEAYLQSGAAFETIGEGRPD
jgi:hypothetical protein